jgi:hypothetical protein
MSYSGLLMWKTVRIVLNVFQSPQIGILTPDFSKFDPTGFMCGQIWFY